MRKKAISHERLSQDLDLMNRDELAQKANRLGLNVGDNEKEQSIKDRIYSVAVQIPPAKLPDPEMRKFLVAATPAEVAKALEAHVNVGLEIVTLNEDEYHFRYFKKEDSGSMKQPLKRIVQCANMLVSAV